MDNSKKICIDYNNMMNEFVGERGIAKKELTRLEPALKAAHEAIAAKRASGGMAFRDLPHVQGSVVDEILDYIAKMDTEIEYFVLLGIGGSALGPLALHGSLSHLYYNDLPRRLRGPKFYVIDNIDPERLVCLLQTIDIKKAIFNVVSKSGQTSETMSQFMIIKELLECALGKEKAKERIIATADEKNGVLIDIAKTEGYSIFTIPNGVIGRLSLLSPVGLLPAAVCGIDIKELLAGAAFMDTLCTKNDMFENPAALYAALHYAALQKGSSICVMMPYSDRLSRIADWYVQLWAESLGKKHDLSGNIVNVGQTPIKALGTTDQHAQVQLFAHGPFDKIVVFLGVSRFNEDIEIPKAFPDITNISFLGGHTHSKLIHTEQAATEYALLKEGKMNMTLTLPKTDPHTIGQLLYMLEAAVSYMGELMNVNAFDQPGVEEGKNVVYAMLGREGYEEKRKDLESMARKKDEYIL